VAAERFVVTDCNSDNGFQTMQALDANGAEVIGLASSSSRELSNESLPPKGF
jgi:hypothetical protein